MNFRRLTAVAVMSIAAVGIAAGTANAEPEALVANGVDHGVPFHSMLSNAGKSVTTTVDAGMFALSSDSNSVTLANNSGQVIAQIPLVYQFAGQSVSVAPAIESAGKTLTLTPTNAANARAQDITSQQWFFSELNRSSGGALAGAIIGGIIGFFFLGIGAIPGALIGAGIGLVVVGGQPLIDSAFAYFGGQP